MSFNETGTVTLDGSGNGTIRLKQVPMGQKWGYVRVAVTIDSGDSSLGGAAEIYAGDDTPNNYLDGTITPWRDTATFDPQHAVVSAPSQFTVKFISCDPGAVARVTATYVVN